MFTTFVLFKSPPTPLLLDGFSHPKSSPLNTMSFLRLSTEFSWDSLQELRCWVTGSYLHERGHQPVTSVLKKMMPTTSTTMKEWPVAPGRRVGCPKLLHLGNFYCVNKTKWLPETAVFIDFNLASLCCYRSCVGKDGVFLLHHWSFRGHSVYAPS